MGTSPTSTPQDLCCASAHGFNRDPGETHFPHQSHAALLDALPDSLLVLHVLPLLSGDDKKALRATHQRTRALLNANVTTIRVAASVLLAHPHARLGDRFPALTTAAAYDCGDASLNVNGLLINFVSESKATLLRLQEVDVKRCHWAGQRLLGALRDACPQLRRLRASRWTDNITLSRDIAGFTSLEELDLGDNDIDIITFDHSGLDALAALPLLRKLSLQRCTWIGDDACVPLSHMSGLRVLDLSHTDVGGRGLLRLADLPRLHSLNLSDCRRIDDEALACGASITGLSSLALRNTEVSNSGLRHVQAMRLLAELDLGSRFELNDEGLAALASCASLRSLSAGSFNLGRPAPRGFACLETLRFGGAFANKGLHLLFPLPRLTSLHVQGIDAVTDPVMKHVSSQTSLQALSLRSGYSLTQDGLASLSPLANLAVLSVSACPAISTACLAAFTGAHQRLGRLLTGACPLLADAHEAAFALARDAIQHM